MEHSQKMRMVPADDASNHTPKFSGEFYKLLNQLSKADGISDSGELNLDGKSIKDSNVGDCILYSLKQISKKPKFYEKFCILLERSKVPRTQVKRKLAKEFLGKSIEENEPVVNATIVTSPQKKKRCIIERRE